MLKIENIKTGYHKKPVLFDVSLEVSAGEIVAIIGPNGAGKSTILKAVSGLLPLWAGKIALEGESIQGNNTSKNIKKGLTFCPQGNRVFDELSVKENLEIGGSLLSKEKIKQRMALVLDFFPVLVERLNESAGNLSGGEQQMLALGRALMPETRLLLLDEPSLGLAPNLLTDVFERLMEINRELGIAMLVVEQKVNRVLGICHRVVGIKLGRVAFSGMPGELLDNQSVVKQLFL